eukprot:2043194-Rhodomonas_salina.2
MEKTMPYAHGLPCGTVPTVCPTTMLAERCVFISEKLLLRYAYEQYQPYARLTFIFGGAAPRLTLFSYS